MKIMCLNGWGGKLHEILLPYIQALAPEILCLQEVVHSPQTGKDWLTYRDSDHVLPQRANFFRDVCHALPDHTAMFCPAAQGVLWDDDQSIPSQWGLVTGRGFTSTRNSHYKKPGRFADYMLINDLSAVQDFDVVYDPEVSDHCPLILTV